METTDNAEWQVARLIPVSGIRNSEEQERRASSALLAVLSAVEEFGLAIVKPYGGLKGTFETFIEVPFELADGKSVRPDGLIRTSRGKRTWTALLEVKTGSNELARDQIEAYLDLAKEQDFDCVITISNQIAMIPGEHPVAVDKRKVRKVVLHHLSWSRVLTEAVLQKSHRGVADPDQAWILAELIRYLEHPNAGSVDFCDMGERWVSVRDAVKKRYTASHRQGCVQCCQQVGGIGLVRGASTWTEVGRGCSRGIDGERTAGSGSSYFEHRRFNGHAGANARSDSHT